MISLRPFCATARLSSPPMSFAFTNHTLNAFVNGPFRAYYYGNKFPIFLHGATLERPLPSVAFVHANRNPDYLPCSASCTLPTIFADGVRVLSPSSFHF